MEKKKTIYISRSMLTDVKLVENLAYQLKCLGFIVKYFKTGNYYSNKDVKEADLVLVHPRVPYNGTVGKGQFDEISLAMKLNIPAFFLETKINPRFAYQVYSDDLQIINSTSWKEGYGSVDLNKQWEVSDILNQIRNHSAIQAQEELLLIVDIK